MFLTLKCCSLWLPNTVYEILCSCPLHIPHILLCCRYLLQSHLQKTLLNSHNYLPIAHNLHRIWWLRYIFFTVILKDIICINKSHACSGVHFFKVHARHSFLMFSDNLEIRGWLKIIPRMHGILKNNNMCITFYVCPSMKESKLSHFHKDVLGGVVISI